MFPAMRIPYQFSLCFYNENELSKIICDNPPTDELIDSLKILSEDFINQLNNSIDDKELEKKAIKEIQEELEEVADQAKEFKDKASDTLDKFKN